jgi:chromosomal replication initiation ATPase DnaA
MSEMHLSLWKGPVPVHEMKSMREIADEVCAEYDITLEQLRGSRGTRRITRPRQDFMWRCRQVKFSWGERRFRMVQIADFLGKKDHTCVVHGVRVHQQRLDGHEIVHGYGADDRIRRSPNARAAG